jgi:hypothetical protein
MMNWKDVEGNGHGLNLRYHPGFCLEGLRKTTKHLSQDSQSPSKDLKPGPPNYEAVIQSYCFSSQSVHCLVNDLTARIIIIFSVTSAKIGEPKNFLH